MTAKITNNNFIIIISFMACFVLGTTCSDSTVKCQNSIFLPFIDDFSSYEGQPNESLWQNGNALVNKGFQFLPPTIGVVTLDILDKEGKIYNHANIYGFSADTLCSVSIRTDSIREPVIKKLSASDSIYFSFFIQPTGAMGNLWERIGSAPSSKDSIILQFYASKQNTWTTVWSMKGTNLDSIYNKDSVYFLQYLIPVTDTAYFNNDFRFRFINYGSLDNNPSYSYISNKGGWNIDYVYMNINRNFKDNTYRDISFVNPACSFIKNFTALPAKHFKKEYMKDTIYNTIINLHSSVLNSNYSYSVSDDKGNIIHSYSGGYENIVSYPQTHMFQTQKNHVAHQLDFAFNPPDGMFSKYTITHVVTEGVGQDNIRSNDTTQFVQKFENYFSYDDGTAESGIGIEPSNASAFAIGFPLLSEDTLYCVDIYFNCSYQQSNLKPFYLYIYDSKEQISVYKDGEGKEFTDTLIVPDEIIYESVKLTPYYDSLNKFHRYYLDEPLIIPKGVFFIAMKPNGSSYMNIGFDQNNDASAFMFEKKGKDWSNIFLKGAPMIRPYFGSSSVGIEHSVYNTDKLNIYPNPAKDVIVIDYTSYGTQNNEVRIFDIQGNLLINQKYVPNSGLDISTLKNGIYILKVGSQTQKLIIAK